jgi:hypothetical protein
MGIDKALNRAPVGIEALLNDTLPDIEVDIEGIDDTDGLRENASMD